MESLSNLLFAISSGLLIPVMIMLICLFIYALVLCVISFSEYNRFVRHRRSQLPIIDAMTPENVLVSVAELESRSDKKIAAILHRLTQYVFNPPARERDLANIQVAMDKRLSRPRLLLKLGPMLGLIGTLIPMGPALTGLASGDVASMAYNMEVAFATTVVGVLIAAIGAVVLQVEKRSCALVLNDLDFINDMLNTYDPPQA